jgi:hypothetical protein
MDVPAEAPVQRTSLVPPTPVPAEIPPPVPATPKPNFLIPPNRRGTAKTQAQLFPQLGRPSRLDRT